jgi:hypothetical protein
MGLYEGRGNLSKAMQILLNKWIETRTGWDDSVADRFEKRWLEPLQHDLQSALAAMDHAAILVSSARRDCS